MISTVFRGFYFFTSYSVSFGYGVHEYYIYWQTNTNGILYETNIYRLAIACTISVENGFSKSNSCWIIMHDIYTYLHWNTRCIVLRMNKSNLTGAMVFHEKRDWKRLTYNMCSGKWSEETTAIHYAENLPTCLCCCRVVRDPKKNYLPRISWFRRKIIFNACSLPILYYYLLYPHVRGWWLLPSSFAGK